MTHRDTRSKPLTARILVAALVASAMVLAGCNTMKGVGKDVEKVGEKTQEAAQKVQNKL